MTAFTKTLKESVDRDEKRQTLVAQIAKLQKIIKSEKQLNKQMELNTQLKKLRKKLEVLSCPATKNMYERCYPAEIQMAL